MRVFLDSSVVLAACGSSSGASREVVRLAASNRWHLITIPYVMEEVILNLPKLPPAAVSVWARLRSELVLLDDVITLDRPVVFPPAKDRPILFSALAWADVLLTHDRGDFGRLLGTEFYKLAILSPGNFLERERAAGRLNTL